MRPSRSAAQGAARIAPLVLLVCIALVTAVAVFVRTGPHPLHRPLLPAPAVAAADRPNLLVIMVDDLDEPMFDLLLGSGWLPHIQHGLVEAGTRFANSFVSDPVCCPSRATYFTGQYVQNHGVLNVTRGVAYWYLAAENREDRVLPVMLREAGYFTGHIGKYLNGYGMFSSREHVPKGYDEWYGLVDPTTYDVSDYTVNRWKRAGGGPAALQSVHADMQTGRDYQTDKLGDWALEFLDGARASGRPFYLTLKPVAPHIETLSFRDDPSLGYRAVFREYIRPAPRHECLVREFLPEYRPQPEPGPWCDKAWPDSLEFLARKPSFNVIDRGKHPRLEKVLQKLTAESGDLGALERQHQMRMAAMLAVDDLVGRVLQRLAADGTLERTLIVFTSDNGYFHGEHGLNSKLLPYEESVRVPLVIRAPGVAAATRAALVLNNDLAPTLADYAGAAPLRADDAFDGRSLRGQLQARPAPFGRQAFLVEHYIETTTTELAAELPLYKDLSEAVTQFLGKLSGIEFGALGNLSYPAYKAVRRIAPGEDLLYVQWYSELTNRAQRSGSWDVDFEELYDLQRDRYEQVNVAPLAADGDDARLHEALQQLRGDLGALRGCKAADCRRAEDR